MRLRSVCWLALPPFAGGAFGAMPTYRRKRPFRRSHLPFATPGGRDLKYHPYTPGARGTGPGFARHSELLNRFADFRNSAPSTGSIGILKLADQELQCADQVAEDDRAALGGSNVGLDRSFAAITKTRTSGEGDRPGERKGQVGAIRHGGLQ